MDNSGEWQTIPTKESRQKELQIKKKKKEDEMTKKREIERKDIQDKQKKIKELFQDSAKAFDLDKNKTSQKYSRHWEVLDEDADDFTPTDKNSKQKKLEKQKDQAKNGYEFTTQLEKEKREKKKQQKIKSKQVQQSKQHHQEEIVPKPFAKVIETFDVPSYVALLNNIESKYPKLYDLQIKVIAEYLEEHFGNALNDAAHLPNAKRIDYLSQFKNSNFRKETVKFFESRNNFNLVPTIVFLVNNLLAIYRFDKSAVASSGVGVEILLQVIFKYFPDNLLKSISIFKSLNLSNQKRSILNLLIWFFSQPLSTQPKVSIQLWFELIFPTIMRSTKDKAPEYVLDSLDNFSKMLFENPKVANHIDVEPETLSQVLENFLFTLQSEKYLPPLALKYSFSLLESKLLFPNGQIASKYFNVLVNNAAISDEQFRDTILEEIIKCLRVDNRCFEYIKENYTTYIAQVNNLLLYINMKYDELHLQKQIPKSKVLDLANFAFTHNERLLIEAQDPKLRRSKGLVIREIEMCQVTCKTVIQNFTPSTTSKFIKYVVYFAVIPVSIATIYLSREYICTHQNQFKNYSPQTDHLVSRICGI